MRHVLIVDDEPFFRAALRSLLPWESHGYAVTGEAIDGAEALAFLRREPVDVVFTDIRMPVMDGIELIRRSRAEGIGARFVVLSAYDEFGLVKGAFLEGARDYVLKAELSADRVLEVLARLGGEGEPDAARYEGRKVCLACLELDGSPDGFADALRVGVAARGGEVLPPADPDRALVVLTFDPARPWQEIAAEVEGFAAIIAAEVRGSRGATVTCGVSSVAESPRDLRSLTAEARRACAYGFFRGRGRVIHAGRVPAPAQAAPDREGPVRLAGLLARRDADGLRDALPRLAIRDPRLTVEDIPAVRDLFAAYLAALDAFAGSARGLDTGRLSARVDRLRSRLAGSADLPELNDLLRDALTEAAGAVSGASRLLRGALSLVHDDPGAPLSLAAAARRLSVTPAYLSRVFSREMGVSFVSYLAGVRMRIAAGLLRDPALKVHEVAERVGYASVEHFSRTFRKVMGASPRALARTAPAE